MRTDLALKTVSAAYKDACNVLYSRRLLIKTDWLATAWQWSLSPMRIPQAWQVRIFLDWGEAKCAVLMSLDCISGITAHLLDNADVMQLPGDLQIALAESALDELFGKIEKASKKRLRVTSISISENEHAIAELLHISHSISWKAHSNAQEFDGELILDEHGLRLAGTAASGLLLGPLSCAGWPLLPIPLRFEVGVTVLPMSTLSTLVVRDVILLDENYLNQGENLTVMVSGNAAFRARIIGSQLTVTKALANVMDETFENEEYNADHIISEMPVKLTFDLGDRTLPLGELQAISPGYIFDLGRDMRQAVVIRANGMRIGEGELINIEGRTGVAILSMSSQSE